jgi:predicted nuclease of predicted toxin-antitoxin system
MKLLTDQDVYAATVQFLRGLGHDVVTAAERGLSQSTDADLLQAAHAEGRVFVTRDRDFGGLVFMQALGAGVLYLRVLPSTLQAVHAELGRVLGLYGEAELQGAFVVVEPGRHRIRRPVVRETRQDPEPSNGQ